ncbi:hypothetical protein BDV30DRAFT_179345 [Aspergillus minisclerotigenes]|uniref:Uncharacterized protein n=1 Tax=Aspergillus minisclerotigenes TaxID=656917 RepID=A0A5N6ITA8_9EURO|nr:hypothetical protein BDV30DRAFT_179345 [Aspergillus minisclerotigenes]
MTLRPKELYPRDASDAEINERTHNNPVTDPEDQSAEALSPRTSFTLPSPEEIDRLARSEDPAERARGQNQQRYQMQLMLLEQQYKRYKMVMERDGKDPESSSS